MVAQEAATAIAGPAAMAVEDVAQEAVVATAGPAAMTMEDVAHEAVAQGAVAATAGPAGSWEVAAALWQVASMTEAALQASATLLVLAAQMVAATTTLAWKLYLIVMWSPATNYLPLLAGCRAKQMHQCSQQPR